MTKNIDNLPKNLAYQHNKKTGAVYVYSVQSYWDREKKAPRNKQVYMGKLDPDSGEVIPCVRRKPRGVVAIPVDGQIGVSATARVAGPSMLLQQVAEDTGLSGILKKCFPESYKQLLSLVFFITQKGLALSRCEAWSASHLHPFDAPIASQRVSELLRSITEGERQRFLAMWLQRMTEIDYLCYDITSISSYAQGNEFVRYGYNRDGEDLAQINMAMLFGQLSKLPAYYRRMQGNISDVATVKTTLKSLNFLGKVRAHFVLDRGFYSQSNIDALLAHRQHFTLAVPSGRKWVEAIIDKHIQSIASPTNYREVGEKEALYMHTVQHKWGESKHRTYLHIYYNAARAGEQYDKFTRKLLKIKTELELGTISEADKKRYSRYFTIKDTPQNTKRITYNDDEIQKYRNRYAGFFCILSNKEKDPVKALQIYRAKEIVENCFDDLKNQLDMKRLRVHDSQAMDTRLFLQFLSLILVCHIRNTLQQHKALQNLTVRETMELLEPIIKIKYAGRHGQLYTETGPKQRNIMDVFNVPPPNP